MSMKSRPAQDEEIASAGFRALAAKLEIAGLHGAIYVPADSDAEKENASIDQALAVVPAAAFSHVLDKVIVDPGRHTDLSGPVALHHIGKISARLPSSKFNVFYISWRDASESGTAIERLLRKQAEAKPSEQSPRDMLKDKAVAAILRFVEKADDETCLRALSAPDEASSLINFLASDEVAGILAEETRDPLAAAVARGIGRRKALIEAEGGTASGQQVADLLGVTRQAVDKRRRNNRMLAVPTGGGDWRYPLWQIQGHKVLPGLEDVLHALAAVGPWTKLYFFLSPTEELQNGRPLDFLRLGKTKEVIECALRLEEHGAR